MKLARKLIALLLILATLATLVPVSAAKKGSSAAGMESRFEASNSFGTMLSQELTGSEAEEDPSWISSITFQGNVATIEGAFGHNATVLVGIYDEDSGEMLTSATVDVTPEDSRCTLSMPNLPDSFVIEAFTVDPESYVPLCGAYRSTYYTSAMQQLREMTVEDFDPDRVLQLTEETDTNFAVYSDGVLQVKEGNKKNNLTMSGSVYCFANADSDLKSAQVGDILSYVPLQGDVLMLEITGISVVLNSLFITGKTPEISQVFDYVKLNTATTLDNAAVNDVEDGVEFYGITYPEKNQPDTRNHDKYNTSAQFNFGLKDFQLDKVSLTAMISFTLGAELEYYLALGEDSFVRFELFYEYSVEFGIEGKIKLRQIRLAEATLFSVYGINLVVTFKFVFEASAKLSHTTSQKGSLGLIASSVSGRFRIQKIATKPVPKQEVSLEGKVFLGLKFEIGLTVLNEYLCKIAGNLTAGLVVTGKMVGKAFYPDANHSCNLCVDGDVKFVLEIGPSVDLISLFHYQGTLLKWERYLGDIWFSFDLAEGGFGSCPNDLDATNSLVQGQTALRNGKCGENLWWTLYENGALEISGEGKMDTYYYSHSVPWEDYQKDIRYAIVNDGCENLSNFTFYNCTNLEYVSLPQSVTKIGEYCFGYCESLLEVELPEGVTSIGAYAFYQCDELADIYLGEDLQKIGGRAFAGCTALNEVLLPVGFETIGQFAFDGCKNLTYVEFPPTIVEIDNSAFLDCVSLESAELPDSLVTLGKEAFNGCTSLTYVRLGSGLTTMGSSAFADCNAITTLEIADGVAEIGDGAFWGCDSLESLTIPGSVKLIKSYAFVACSNIKELTLHEGIETIRGWSFKNCDSISSVTIPDSVAGIYNFAFQSCDNLTTVNFGSGLEHIAVGAFRDCPQIRSVVLPEGLKEMGDEVFSECTSITSATLGGDLKRIGNSAFYGCDALEEVTIRPGTEAIGDAAFWCCTSLTSVELPDSVVELDSYAFVSCTSLKSIDLGSSLQVMEGSCLKNTALTTLEIPAGVTYLGSSALAKNDYLTSVRFTGDAPEFQRTAFENTTTTVYYPSNRSGWTSEVLQDYGGDLTWVPYTASAATSFSAEKSLAFIESSAKADTKSSEIAQGLARSSRYLLVVARSEKEPLLDSSNLIYAKQYLSDHSGTLALNWPEVSNVYIALYGKNGVTVLAKPSGGNSNDDPDSNCNGGANCPSRIFTDVDPEQWYHQGIDFALDNGLFNGMSANKFEPDTPMTRAMLVTVLWRYAGEPSEGTNNFTDVQDGQWYAKAVTWAAHNGIVNGVGAGRFDPDGKITREQMAAILYRYAQSIGVDVSAQADLSSYPDARKVSSYAQAPLSWAVAKGIIGGTTSGGRTVLDPQGNATRAQVAVILMRFITG